MGILQKISWFTNRLADALNFLYSDYSKLSNQNSAQKLRRTKKIGMMKYLSSFQRMSEILSEQQYPSSKDLVIQETKDYAEKVKRQIWIDYLRWVLTNWKDGFVFSEDKDRFGEFADTLCYTITDWTPTMTLTQHKKTGLIKLSKKRVTRKTTLSLHERDQGEECISIRTRTEECLGKNWVVQKTEEAAVDLVANTEKNQLKIIASNFSTINHVIKNKAQMVSTRMHALQGEDYQGVLLRESDEKSPFTNQVHTQISSYIDEVIQNINTLLHINDVEAVWTTENN